MQTVQPSFIPIDTIPYHASGCSYNKGAYSSDFGYAVNGSVTHLNGHGLANDNEGGEEELEERGNENEGGEEEDGFVIPSGSLSYTVR
jgi:hypothetical protein